MNDLNHITAVQYHAGKSWILATLCGSQSTLRICPDTLTDQVDLRGPRHTSSGTVCAATPRKLLRNSPAGCDEVLKESTWPRLASSTSWQSVGGFNLVVYLSKDLQLCTAITTVFRLWNVMWHWQWGCLDWEIKSIPFPCSTTCYLAPTSRQGSLNISVIASAASLLTQKKRQRLAHRPPMTSLAPNINAGQSVSVLVSETCRMFSVSPPPFPPLSVCQMWGHGWSHTDLPAGSGEDPSAVVLHHLLYVSSSA